MAKEIQIIKEDSLIKCGAYEIGIGRTKQHIAIYSMATGKICEFKNIRKGGKLAKIKRKFAKRLSSSEQFYFEYMTEEDTLEMIKMLKSK